MGGGISHAEKKKIIINILTFFFFLPNRVSQSDHVCAAAKIRRRRGGGVITRFGASLNLTSSSSSVSRSRRSASSTADDRTDRQAALGRKLGNRRVTTAAGWKLARQTYRACPADRTCAYASPPLRLRSPVRLLCVSVCVCVCVCINKLHRRTLAGHRKNAGNTPTPKSPNFKNKKIMSVPSPRSEASASEQ